MLVGDIPVHGDSPAFRFDADPGFVFADNPDGTFDAVRVYAEPHLTAGSASAQLHQSEVGYFRFFKRHSDIQIFRYTFQFFFHSAADGVDRCLRHFIHSGNLFHFPVLNIQQMKYLIMLGTC